MADSISRITDTAGSATVSLILSDEEKRKREASRRGTSVLGGLGHFASVSGSHECLLVTLLFIIGCLWWCDWCGVQASGRLATAFYKYFDESIKLTRTVMIG